MAEREREETVRKDTSKIQPLHEHHETVSGKLQPIQLKLEASSFWNIL